MTAYDVEQAGECSVSTKYTHEWRFKEQDGDWSLWYPCTASEASMKASRWDTEVRERFAA